MVMLSKRTVVLAKIEGTYGSDPTPTNSANAIQAFELNSPDIEPELIKRGYGNADMSKYPELRGKTGFAYSFKTHLRGSGTAGTAPRRGPLYRAAGLAETVVSSTSVTYAPRSSSQESATIYGYIDGILMKLLGAVSNYELELVAGQPGVETWAGKALYAIPTDVALVTPTFDSPEPPLMKGLTMTIGSYGAICEKISLKMNNVISERPDFNQTEGIKGFQVTDRDPDGEMTIEAVLRATSNADFLSYFHSRNSKALSIAIGSTAGNIITITAPAVYMRQPKFDDRDGVRTMVIPIQYGRSSGNDEISIAMT